MKMKLSLCILALCCLLLSAGASESADITNPILKKLVEKGVLSEPEAMSVLQDLDRETAEKDKKTEEKIELKAAGAAPEETKDLEKIAKTLKGFKFSGLWYLSYQYGKTGSTSKAPASVFNSFNVKRGYLTVEKELTPWFSGRLTTDVTTVNLSTSLPSGSSVSLNETGSSGGKDQVPVWASQGSGYGVPQQANR